ncbi:MAG TPA: hypothetical protein VFV37_08955 [Luteibaculaceae bacterium]|nr:hypothetical protein [Luteibaculaceae bacterium]
MSTPTENTAALLLRKAGLKQDVYESAIRFFECLSGAAAKLVTELEPQVRHADQRVRLEYISPSDHEFQMKVGSDVLIFILHTNVFHLDPKHPCWNEQYIKDDVERSYFGIVNIYNFLHDSIHYNRSGDVGYLVCRLFVNKWGHFFLETRQEDQVSCSLIQTEAFTLDKGKEIINELIQFVTEFDLFVPPFEQVAEITVDEVNAEAQTHKLKTAKRLGFNYGLHD